MLSELLFRMFYILSGILNAGIKNAPDPGSASTTLLARSGSGSRTGQWARSKTGKPDVLWIRIRTDPHSLGCPGSRSVLGTRIRIQEHENWTIFTNRSGFSLSKRLLTFVGTFFDLLPTTSIFLMEKKFSFSWLESLTRIRIRIGLAPWIWIRIVIKS